MRSLFAGLAAALLSFLPVGAFAQSEAYPQGRLPDLVTPIAYRLDLTVDPSQTRFSGHTEIDVTIKAATTSIFLHGRELAVSRAIITTGGRTIAATYTEVDPLGVARLDFPETIPAGAATLSFDYDAPFGEGPAGLFHVKGRGRVVCLVAVSVDRRPRRLPFVRRAGLQDAVFRHGEHSARPYGRV